MHLNVYIWIKIIFFLSRHKTFTKIIKSYLIITTGALKFWLFDECDSLDSSTCGLDLYTVQHKAMVNLHHISLFFFFLDLARKIYKTSPNEIWDHAEWWDFSSGSIQTVMGKNREHLRIAVLLMIQLDQSQKVIEGLLCTKVKEKHNATQHIQLGHEM